MHQLFINRSRGSLGEVVGQVGGVVIGFNPVEVLQQLTNAQMQPDSSGGGQLRGFRFLY